MNIFINNQEVVCSRNMQIKESLANTNSVILNNVYPKEWETDKDYTSRFYMPEDYSHCVIKNDNNKIYEYNVNTYSWSNRFVYDVTSKIAGRDYTKLAFIPVCKGITYKMVITSYMQEDMYVYEGNSYDISAEVTPIATIKPGENTLYIKPNLKYLVYNRVMPNNITANLLKSITTYDKIKVVNLSKNVFIAKDRQLNSTNNTIHYDNTRSIRYIKVIPGATYTLRVSNTESLKYICETDSIDIGNTCDRVQYISWYAGGTGGFTITPTKKYLVLDSTGNITDIFYYAPTNILFSGVVKNSGNINLNPRYPHYATLQLLDYKTLLSEGETLNYVLEKQSVSSAIKKIVEGLEGFYIGNISLETDDIIEAYNCNEKTPYDILEYLAEITGAIWYTQTITEDITLINFCSIDNLPTANTLEYNQNYFSDNNIQDIQYSYSANDYRNKQIITSDNTISSVTQNESISYNGVDLRTTYPIAKITKIMIGDKEYSAASNIDKKNGIYADYYYTYGETSIDPNKELATGTILNVTYYSIVNSRQIAYNQEEIDRININTGRNGIISRYEKRTDTNDQTALNQIAQTYIDYKSVPEVTIKVQSYNKDIYELGNRVFFDGPIEQLKTNYLVKEKQIDMITTGEQQELFYTYTLSSSFNDKNAINFFDNQRRKLEGNIEERTIHNKI